MVHFYSAFNLIKYWKFLLIYTIHVGTTHNVGKRKQHFPVFDLIKCTIYKQLDDEEYNTYMIHFVT